MKRIVLLMLLSIVATSVFGQADKPVFDFTPDYRAAVAEFYKASPEDMALAEASDLPIEALPVVFCVATKSETPVSQILEMKADTTWQDVIEAVGLTTTDLHVHLTSDPVGPRYKRTYAKFDGLTRQEFSQVWLDDKEYAALVNLRFLYRHYNYSPHLIMTWVSEGKSFPEINHLLIQFTEETKTAKGKKETEAAKPKKAPESAEEE